MAALGLTTSQYTNAPVEAPLSPPPTPCSLTITVSTRQGLEQELGHCPPGSLAFLKDEQSMVFKVELGWRYLVAGGLVSGREGRDDEPFYSESSYSWGQ